MNVFQQGGKGLALKPEILRRECYHYSLETETHIAGIQPKHLNIRVSQIAGIQPKNLNIRVSQIFGIHPKHLNIWVSQIFGILPNNFITVSVSPTF